jgi:pyridoxal phosphate enzyme (YggS family)
MSVSENLNKVRSTLPAGVKLIAVSKTKPISAIIDAYNCGQRLFGENKVQELTEKFESLPKEIEWHLIGHLQTNKVKYVASFVAMIHAVDSLKLLAEINKEASKHNRIINCLLQFHIAQEDTKFGLDFDGACEILDSSDFRDMKNVHISGVMGMATYTDNIEQVSCEFGSLRNIFIELKNRYFTDDSAFSEISMGMSDDYLIAIEQGATMVRVGSTIFGERVYL